MPLQADSTSWRRGCTARYSPNVARMKSTSAAVGRGSAVSAVGESVVPAIALPSQGSRKTTRPSFVFGTIRPCFSGLRARAREQRHQS